MSRFTTPFDLFMHDLMNWLYSAWFVWIGMAAALAITVAVVVISKRRARARARIPQYRRQLHPD